MSESHATLADNLQRQLDEARATLADWCMVQMWSSHYTGEFDYVRLVTLLSARLQRAIRRDDPGPGRWAWFLVLLKLQAPESSLTRYQRLKVDRLGLRVRLRDFLHITEAVGDPKWVPSWKWNEDFELWGQTFHRERRGAGMLFALVTLVTTVVDSFEREALD